MLFVGQISQRKGISYLLRAYDNFRGPGTSLTLVGNIVKDCKKLEYYKDIFSYMPNIPRIYLREIYQKADVFLFPTLAEGMPLVVLEAMASGLPVITTPNGHSDIVRDGIDGFIVPIRDVKIIEEKLEILRSNPEMRVEMGENARKRALEFSWEAYQEKTSNTIKSWMPENNKHNIFT